METKTYNVPLAGMKEIYDVACSSWKQKIKKMTDPFEDSILTNEQVNEMFTAADPTQIKVLKKWIKRGGDTSLIEIKGNLTYFKEDGGHSESMIAIRNGGDYIGKSFWLNYDFKWEIKTDKNGSQILIPTPL